jgi:hypothetical protein
MPLAALGVTALLAGLDWGAWDWATNTGHDTVGLIAGLLMVPAVVAFVGVLAITLVGLVRIGAHRAAVWRRERAEQVAQRTPPSPPRGEVSASSPATTPRGRIAI